MAARGGKTVFRKDDPTLWGVHRSPQVLPNWRRAQDSWHIAPGPLVRLKYSAKLPCECALGCSARMAVYVLSRGVKANQKDDAGSLDCCAMPPLSIRSPVAHRDGPARHRSVRAVGSARALRAAWRRQ